MTTCCPEVLIRTLVRSIVYSSRAANMLALDLKALKITIYQWITSSSQSFP